MTDETPLPLRTIVFFDFDGTLAQGDSLWPFLVAVAGLPCCVRAVAHGLCSYLLPAGRDRRTIIKAKLLSAILQKRRVSDLAPAIERMKSWPRWLSSVEDLERHFACGHHIVIATGSLNLYIQEMLGDLPYHAILCTTMEEHDSVLTGRMASGNCVRKRKAELVAAYMKEHGTFDDSWAYGNAPHDFPMMDLVQHRVVI